MEAHRMGSRVFAEALKVYGADHFFHVPVILPGGGGAGRRPCIGPAGGGRSDVRSDGGRPAFLDPWRAAGVYGAAA